MNETEAVLDFFSRKENLSLALDVGEVADKIRLEMANTFWQKLAADATKRTMWANRLTYDQQTDGQQIVGLTLSPQSMASNCILTPFMEQQASATGVRIYYGLLWNLPANVVWRPANLSELQLEMQAHGFKCNERFLAWRWTTIYPRNRDFLLKFSTQPEETITAPLRILTQLIDNHGTTICNINESFSRQRSPTTIPLRMLHGTQSGD